MEAVKELNPGLYERLLRANGEPVSIYEDDMEHVLKTHTVDALKFTPELGAEIAAEAELAEKELRAPAHPSNVTFLVGRGYFHDYQRGGERISFGDYLVTTGKPPVTRVMTGKEFAEKYEPKAEAE